jgi:hypothetical protein
MRRRLSSDPELLALARDALLGELRDTGWTADTWPKSMLKAATEVARTKGATNKENTMLRLNSFFNTERFRYAHLTTGTVFYHAKTDQYFVTASPACDLVARRPSSAQSWAHSIFPLTPLVAILLEQKTVGSALMEAENGLHIFLESGSDQKAFKVVQGSGHKPSYEFFMVKDEGKVRNKDGKLVFDASRLTPRVVGTGAAAKASETERDWVDDTFEVIDQLKGMNATHILQLAGQHLSRIGLDYIGMPKA